MTTNPRPPVIHQTIERDNRLRWHPQIELRHKGVLIYAVTAVKGYWQAGEAVVHATRETQALLRGG